MFATVPTSIERPAAEADRRAAVRMIHRTVHAADDRRLAVIVLISSALVALAPASTPVLLSAVLLVIWSGLERHASAFLSSFVLQRQRATRMRLDFIAGLFAVAAYVFAIVRTMPLLAGEDEPGPRTVMFFCVVGAAMCWVAFNQAWQVAKSALAAVIVGSCAALALSFDHSNLRSDVGIQAWASNFVRVSLLLAACHGITWRAMRPIQTGRSVGLSLNLVRTAIFAALLMLAIERPAGATQGSGLERWLWMGAAGTLAVCILVDFIQMRGDFRKEFHALRQVIRGESVPPRRRRLGIWTQAVLIPASTTIGLAPWPEWLLCAACGTMASLFALPPTRVRSANPKV